MQKTKKEIIEEVVEFYGSDPTRRAVDCDCVCNYLSEDGKKCAVGRYLSEGKSIVSNSGGTYSYQSYLGSVGTIKNLKEILNEDVRGLPVSFWVDIQNFHDDSDNFSFSGLSQKGEVAVQNLKAEYCEC